MEPTKFDNAECAKLQRESLNCLINNGDNKNVRQPFFDRYKKCLKDRREREIAERVFGVKQRQVQHYHGIRVK